MSESQSQTAPSPLARLDAHNRGGREYTREAMERDLRSLVEQLEALRASEQRLIGVGNEVAREGLKYRAMLEELVDACEYLALYPEGAAGIEELREVQHEARKLLDSYPASEPHKEHWDVIYPTD